MSDEVGGGSFMSLVGLWWLAATICAQTSYEFQTLTQTNRYPLDALQCYAMIRNRIQTVIWTMTKAHMRGQHPSNRHIQTTGVYKVVEA